MTRLAALAAMLLSSTVSGQSLVDGVSAKSLSMPLTAASPPLAGHSRTYRAPDASSGLPVQMTIRRERSTALEVLSEVRALHRGIGIDMGLPEAGNLHLNLYSGRDVWGRGGARWAPMSFDREQPSRGRLWSLGAALDVVHFRALSDDDAPDSRVVVSPQLRLDLDAIAGLPGRFDLLIQDTPWRGADNRAVDGQRVVQVMMKWRF